MRKYATFVILFCVLYFLGGWFAVQFGIFDDQKYFAYAGIVGGLASVAGLVALVRPAITTDDMQSIELDALKSFTKTTEELRDLENKRSKTVEEIDLLSIRKKEMELLVKKASLSLFLSEQQDHLNRKISDIIDENTDLRNALGDLRDVQGKLAALGDEIEADPNVSLLEEVIESSRQRASTIDEAINDLPPTARAFATIARSGIRGYANLLRNFFG